jgi:hypothetical protein
MRTATQRVFLGAIVCAVPILAGPVLWAAPGASGTSTSEQGETAALNLQSLRNSEILNAPGANAGVTGVTQPGTVPSDVPLSVGSSRGESGRRAATVGGGGAGKAGKSGSRGSKRGGRSAKNAGKRQRG